MQIENIPFFLKLFQTIDFPHKLGILDKFYGKTLAKKNICWIKTSTGIIWKLDLRNPTHRWIVYGNYQGSGFIKWAKKNLTKNSIVVDSGANIGQMTLYFSQIISNGKVYAFEPGKIQFSWLKECINYNRNLRVEIVPLGLSNKNTTMKIFDPGSEITHGAQSQISNHKGSQIEVVKLSDYLKDKRIEKVDLWKIDVEGHELFALEGAKEHLKNKSIKYIYIEMLFEEKNRIESYLNHYGYKSYKINYWGQIVKNNSTKNNDNLLFCVY